MAPHLDRRVGNRRAAPEDHTRRTLIDGGAAEQQNTRKDNGMCSSLPHGSTHPNELDTPVVRIVGVAGQRVGHALADQLQAGRVDTQLDQILPD